MAHVVPHIAAQEALKKRKAEEEEMTPYTSSDLKEDWEFKIMRSATGEFKKPEVVEMLKATEAQAGWKMVEKFDDNRIRFKRSGDAFKKDATLPPGIDPYRTQYGMSEGGLAFRIILVCFGVLGLILFTLNLFGLLS